VVLCALLAACSSAEERFARHTQRGETYVEAGEWQQALIEYRNALAIDPESAAASQRIAELLEAVGRPGDALFYYQEATRLDPDRNGARLAAARLFMGDDRERARALVDEAIAREPDDALARVVDSQLALVESDLDAARAAALTAIELDPKLPAAHDQLGVVYQAQLRAERLGLIEPDPDAAGRALAAFARALELEPEGRRWRTRLKRAAVFASVEDQQQEASAEYRQALTEGAASRSDATRASVANAVRVYARSIEDEELERDALAQLVGTEGVALATWRELAEREERLGGSADAVLERLLEERPGDVEAHALYAFHLAQSGRGEQAVAHLEDRIARGSDPPRALAAIANVAEEAGLVDVRRSAVDRLLQEYPDHPRTQLALAQRALTEGRRGEARDQLRELADGRLVASEVFFLLARVEYALGDLAAATEAVERSISLAPAFPVPAYALRAKIQQDRGDWAGVNESLRELFRQTRVRSVEQRLMNIRAFYETGQVESARKRLNLLLREEQNRTVEAVVEFARREGGRSPVRARRLLEELLERDPKAVEATLALARLEVAQGDLAAARAHLDATITRPASPPAEFWVLRAQVRAAQNDLAGAEIDARRALNSARRSPTTQALLATILVQEGKSAEAVTLMEQLQELEMLAPASQSLLGQLYLQAGRRQEARTAYERALQAGGAPAAAKNDLAFLLADEGVELDRALSLAREAQSELPEEPAVAHTLGYVLLRKGLVDPAIEQLGHALELAEQRGEVRPEFHLHRGLALRQAGRQQEATRALEKALALGTDFEGAEAARQTLAELREAAGAS
jgi:tetratricopeptide (TPR) repeat protein